MTTETVATPAVQPAPGDVVRVVATVPGQQEARFAYAHVLSVTQSVPELLGANGEPALSVVLLQSEQPGVSASRAAWQDEFSRLTGVKHSSHPHVLAGSESAYYTDTLPKAGLAVTLAAMSPNTELDDTGEVEREVKDGVGQGPAALESDERAKIAAETEAEKEAKKGHLDN